MTLHVKSVCQSLGKYYSFARTQKIPILSLKQTMHPYIGFQIQRSLPFDCHGGDPVSWSFSEKSSIKPAHIIERPRKCLVFLKPFLMKEKEVQQTSTMKFQSAVSQDRIQTRKIYLQEKDRLGWTSPLPLNYVTLSRQMRFVNTCSNVLEPTLVLRLPIKD